MKIIKKNSMVRILLFLAILPCFMLSSCSKYKGEDLEGAKKFDVFLEQYKSETIEVDKILMEYEKFVAAYPQSLYLKEVQKKINEAKKIAQSREEVKRIRKRKKELESLLENGYKGFPWGVSIAKINEQLQLEEGYDNSYKKWKGNIPSRFFINDQDDVLTYYEFFNNELFRVSLRYRNAIINPKSLLEKIRNKYGDEVERFSEVEEKRDWMLPTGKIIGYTKRVVEYFIWENNKTRYSFSFLKKIDQDHLSGSKRVNIYRPRIEIWDKELVAGVNNEIKKDKKNRGLKEEREKENAEQKALDSI